MIELDISVACPGWQALGDAEALARRAAEAVFAVSARAPRKPVEISLLFGDDDTVRALNAGWRSKDKPTNVLSFPAAVPAGMPGPQPLGDIVLAYETCAGEAVAEGKSLADHASHLIVHGILHLLGYDHIEMAAAEEMEALETEALARIGIGDPYADAQISA